MDDPYQDVEQARQTATNAERALELAKQKLHAFELRFREALGVGPNIRVKTAMLPDGRVVVHIWCNGSGDKQVTMLHVEKPKRYDFDANPIEPS